MTENRVFQHLTHQKYAENYADSESGNGFFLAPVQEWSMSKILLPKNPNLQRMKQIDSPGAPWAHGAPWGGWGGSVPCPGLNRHPNRPIDVKPRQDESFR